MLRNSGKVNMKRAQRGTIKKITNLSIDTFIYIILYLKDWNIFGVIARLSRYFHGMCDNEIVYENLIRRDFRNPSFQRYEEDDWFGVTSFQNSPLDDHKKEYKTWKKFFYGGYPRYIDNPIYPHNSRFCLFIDDQVEKYYDLVSDFMDKKELTVEEIDAYSKITEIIRKDWNALNSEQKYRYTKKRAYLIKQYHIDVEEMYQRYVVARRINGKKITKKNEYFDNFKFCDNIWFNNVENEKNIWFNNDVENEKNIVSEMTHEISDNDNKLVELEMTKKYFFEWPCKCEYNGRIFNYSIHEKLHQKIISQFSIFSFPINKRNLLRRINFTQI